jgi:hypothetical protein
VVHGLSVESPRAGIELRGNARSRIVQMNVHDFRCAATGRGNERPRLVVNASNAVTRHIADAFHTEHGTVRTDSRALDFNDSTEGRVGNRRQKNVYLGRSRQNRGRDAEQKEPGEGSQRESHIRAPSTGLANSILRREAVSQHCIAVDSHGPSCPGNGVRPPGWAA